MSAWETPGAAGLSILGIPQAAISTDKQVGIRAADGPSQNPLQEGVKP